jgi:hypothetical protein
MGKAHKLALAHKRDRRLFDGESLFHPIIAAALAHLTYNVLRLVGLTDPK